MTHSYPVRTCIGCRKKGVKPLLVRFVFTPDGEICLDSRQRMPGRGAYICREVACLEKAWKKRAFIRALRIPSSRLGMLDKKVYDRLKREMEGLVPRDERRSEEGDLNEQT